MMNEFSLKITGTASIPEQLDASQAIYLVTELDCYEVAKRNKQNGVFELIYKTKIIGHSELRQGEKRQISKDKTKASQRLRFAIEDKAKLLGVEDVEAYYQGEINRIINSYKED